MLWFVTLGKIKIVPFILGMDSEKKKNSFIIVDMLTLVIE